MDKHGLTHSNWVLWILRLSIPLVRINIHSWDRLMGGKVHPFPLMVEPTSRDIGGQRIFAKMPLQGTEPSQVIAYFM